MDLVNRHLVITGRVQGVAYRAGVLSKAVELGLMGTARNLPDGSVQIEAEGDPGAVERFISWCHKGPPLAHVENVTVGPGPIRGFTSFSVVRLMSVSHLPRPALSTFGTCTIPCPKADLPPWGIFGTKHAAVDLP
ncbi:MAG: acylphosphatase [Flavobacteriales bacterium]